MCDALQVESVLNCMVMRQDDDDDSPFWKRKDTSMDQSTGKCGFGLCCCVSTSVWQLAIS